MKKKIPDLQSDFTSAIKKLCAEHQIEFKSCDPKELKSAPQKFKDLVRDFENDRIQSNSEAVKRQNKLYYEMNARTLIDKRDRENDKVSRALATILLREKNMDEREFVPSPSK